MKLTYNVHVNEDGIKNLTIEGESLGSYIQNIIIRALDKNGLMCDIKEEPEVSEEKDYNKIIIEANIKVIWEEIDNLVTDWIEDAVESNKSFMKQMKELKSRLTFLHDIKDKHEKLNKTNWDEME